MHQITNRPFFSSQPNQQSWVRQLLPFTVVPLLMLSMPVQAQASERCEGFRFVRDRSDHEAPLLPRQSIAARAVWSPDRCAQPRSADHQSDRRVEGETVLNSDSPEPMPESNRRQPAPSESQPDSLR